MSCKLIREKILHNSVLSNLVCEPMDSFFFELTERYTNKFFHTEWEIKLKYVFMNTT